MLLASPPARAQGAEIATAQALFDEALALTDQGRYAEACPKFEESQRIDPGPGTQLNLADCHEHLGRVATAWALFVEAEATARRNSDERRAAFARQRIVSLGPRLPRLRLLVEPQEADLTITRDQTPLGKAQWGVALPIDPGSYRFAASAAGRQPWSTQIEVTEPGKEIILRVPVLPPSSAASATASGTGSPASSVPAVAGPAVGWSGREKLAAGLATGGLLALGTGAVLGLVARRQYQAVAAGCEGGCDEASWEQRTEARTKGNVATIFGLGGALLGGTATYLWLTRGPAGGTGSAGPWLSPAIGRGAAGVIAQGHF